MMICEARAQASAQLGDHSIENRVLEADILLGHALGFNRVQLYQELHSQLSSEQEAAFRKLVCRRTGGEPAAYITGKREFYGLDFFVDPRVLIPRPETEMLVDKAIKTTADNRSLVIADIGTGSGAIAVSLAVHLPQCVIYACDISAEALAVASLNCRENGVAHRIRLLQGDLLTPLPEAVDLVVANLPYVRKADMPENGLEPGLALFGGTDGLDEIRRLCLHLPDRLRPGGRALLEIGYGQSAVLVSFLRRHLPSAYAETAPDLAGIDRLMAIRL